MKIFLLAFLCSIASLAEARTAPLPMQAITIQKKTSGRSQFSLYPDAEQKSLFFSVRGRQGKVYQLFVFDLDGKMVKQREIRNKQTTLIKDIEKGTYLFEVFSDDDRIGNGQIAVK